MLSGYQAVRRSSASRPVDARGIGRPLGRRVGGAPARLPGHDTAVAGRGAGDAPPGRPRAEDRAGRRRAGRRQPGGDRLGRGRAALRRRDDRLPGRADRPGKLRLLEDRDGDGRYERRHGLRRGARTSPTACSPGTAACWSPPLPTSCSSRTPTATASPTSVAWC